MGDDKNTSSIGNSEQKRSEGVVKVGMSTIIEEPDNIHMQMHNDTIFDVAIDR